MRRENVTWIKHEAFELVKQASAVVVAIVTLGGFIITSWGYLDLWIPESTQKHAEDIKKLEDTNNALYNQLKRMALESRIEILQMRVTNLAGQTHDMEDAIAVHQRAINNSQVPDSDKEIAKRRIVQLNENLKWTVERQRGVYANIAKIREAMLKLPYDPNLGDISELRE